MSGDGKMEEFQVLASPRPGPISSRNGRPRLLPALAGARELALKELTAAADGAEGIALNDVARS